MSYKEPPTQTRPAPISAVIVDVGGTLWPDRPRLSEADGALRASRLLAAVPALTPDLCPDLIRHLEGRASELDVALEQDTDGCIREVAEWLGLALEAPACRAVREAMCLPARGRVELFAGARDFLATIKALRLRCVILSNAIWRGAEAYRRDFEDLGVSAYLDAIVTSIEVGFRKPHRAMFEAALAAAGCPAVRCVLVGNSERNDVEPAVALGLRVIRVAIEEPRPASTVAQAVAGSLHEAAAILRAWAG